MRARLGGETGQIAPLFLVLSVVVLGALGFVIDLGMAMNSRAELTYTAGAAARAGTAGLDPTISQHLGIPTLDPALARDDALAYLRQVGFVGRVLAVSVSPDDRQVQVSIEQTRPTSLLRLFGVGRLTVHAVGTASPREG